jgi:hypothetical protein
MVRDDFVPYKLLHQIKGLVKANHAYGSPLLRGLFVAQEEWV